MALIKCPECNKEISDSLDQCPHCGFVLKKKKSNKTLITIVMILVIALVGGGLSYFFYFKPNSIMNQAENLINRGKFAEADLLLASIPSGNRKSELMTRINLGEAREALNNGDYALAERVLSDVPEADIPEDLQYSLVLQKADALILEEKYDEADALFANLPQTDETAAKRNKIREQAATALLNKGQYNRADEWLAKMDQTEEVIALREELFYESRVLQCSLMVKDILLFPESMKLTEALLFKGGKTKNKNESTEELEVYDFDQPTVLIHYQAKTRGGSITDGFVRFTWDDNTYTEHVSVDSLNNDSESEQNRKTKYMDTDELLEYWEEQREIAYIRLLLYASTEAILEDEQLERVNNAIQVITAKTIETIANNEIVPLPTPEIISVTPEPTEAVEEAVEAAEVVEEATEMISFNSTTEEAAEQAEGPSTLYTVKPVGEATVYYFDNGSLGYHLKPDVHDMKNAPAHTLAEAIAAGKIRCNACNSPDESVLSVEHFAWVDENNLIHTTDECENFYGRWQWELNDLIALLEAGYTTCTVCNADKYAESF